MSRRVIAVILQCQTHRGGGGGAENSVEKRVFFFYCCDHATTFCVSIFSFSDMQDRRHVDEAVLKPK